MDSDNSFIFVKVKPAGRPVGRGSFVNNYFLDIRQYHKESFFYTIAAGLLLTNRKYFLLPADKFDNSMLQH